MTTISEDYVSFEIAKLLRDKGFNEHCYTYYDDIDDTINRFDKGYHFNNTSYPWGVPYDVNKAKKYVVAPTLQTAMKWLREKYNIIISITPKRDKYYFTPWELWDSEWVHTKAILPLYDTYEEACEAAIKYSLENLI